MKSVNSDYLRFIEENNFLDYAYRIELQRSDGKAYTYEGDVIQSFEINGTESSSGFSIGETLSLQLKLTLLLEERQGEKDIPTNSKLIPYIIYKWTEKVDDEVVNHEEETCMGIFYVNDVKADHRHKVSITAVDAMSATDIFGGTFTETQLTPPVDNRFIAQEIANLFPDDIVFDVSEEPGLVVNTLVFNEYIYGKSFREILGYIAAANSGFARVVPELVVINEETGETALKSRLQFATYKDTGIVLRMNNDDDTPNLYSKIKSVKSGTNKFGLKKIATTAYVKNKDTESEDNPNDENKSAYATATITYPTNSNAKPYETLEFDCPFIASSGCYIREGVVRIDYATEQNLKAIYDEISQISYYPIDATLFGYHFLECGDIVKIENTYGEILDLYIQDVKMTVGGGVTVTVSSKYDYTKSNTLKNSVTARVDSLAKELHSFANNFEISKNKIEMSVSKAEAETIIQENLADLNMGVNQWIREVYNLDGVEGIEKPRSIQLQGKSPIITDIIKDPEDAKFPTLEEFTGTEEENNNGAIFGTRTVRYATCVKVNERTTIGIMVRQGYENASFIPQFDNVAVYVNTDLKLPPDINTQDGVREYLKLSKLDKVVHGVDENGKPTTELVPEEITEGTEHYGYYTYNAVLNAGWNIIEIMHYENIGNYLEIKCGRVDVEDINVVDDIQDVNELHEVDIFTKSPFIGLVNCNALSITYTRFVGAEFTIESDAIKQVVTEITDMTKKVGELETTYDSISARVEETRIDIEDLETKYTEIKNTADEITLTANQTKESVEEIETKMNGTMEVVTRLEEESQLAVKKDEISTYVQEEISYTMGEIEQNYVQKSEMEQNNAEIKMSFSQSGGYNLIQESAFYNDEAFGQDGIWKLISNNSGLSYMRYTYEDKLGYPDPNANTLFFPKLSSHDKEGAQSYNPYMEQDLDLVPGKTYTFSMQFASPDGENSWAKSEGKMDFRLSYNGTTIHSTNLWTSATEESINNGEEGNRMTEGGKTDDGWIKCKTQFHIPKSYGLQKDTNEDGVIDDNDIQPLTFTLRISFTKTPHESRLLIVHPLLVEGELDMVYSPNPNEMYTGVTRINKDGIKVSRSDSTVATTIDYKGMTITTDQSVAAEFRSDYAYVPVARIDKVINSNIPSKGSRPNVLIVNKTKYEQAPDENTFRTLQECFDSFPDITTSEITIEIQENTNGGYLRDKSGSPIEIILWKNVQVGSTIILSNVNNSISIHSEDQTFEENGYPYGYIRGIACSNCHNVTISYLHLDELTYADANNLNDLGIGINAYRNVSTAIILEGSTATVKFCNVLSNINYVKDGINISCIVAARNSRCITYNCRGNTSSRTNIKYVYLSLGYSFLYIARHNELLKDTDANINTDTVLNVLPSGIKLIKFPNNEANLTTFTNREYEANCDHFDKYPEAGITNPSYDKISENAKVYSKSRVQQTRNYDNSNGKYMITNKINGGSSVGTVRRNNKYCYDRTIFEFDPEKFRSALFSAQTKSYDSNGNPINDKSPVEAKLVIEAESLGEYVNRSGYPSNKYVPVNILMYSDLEYAYDDAKRDSADPKFGEGIKEYETDEVGRYDYVPNNVLASNTAYLDDNNDKWTYANHGFYSDNMTIEIPIHFNMKSLNSELSSSYRNGVEDLKNGRIRYVIVETGIYAQDEKGNLIQGETASVKLKDIHFDLSYEVIQAQKPNSGGDEGDLIVPDYSGYSDFESRYEDWCNENNITLVIALEYSNSILKDGFIRTNPSVGSTVKSGGTLSLYESKGPENEEPEVETVTVPDMVGWTKTQVNSWASTNEIIISFTERINDNMDPDLVISTDPTAGTVISKNSTLSVYISKKATPTYDCTTSLSDNMNFPVWQGRRLYSDGTWGAITYGCSSEEFVNTGIGYMAEDFASQYQGINYMRHCRKIFRFCPEDFVNKLQNATIQSASIVINATTDLLNGYTVKNTSSAYYGKNPFRVGIYNDLKNIADSPNHISNSINSKITVDSSVQTVNKVKSDLGRWVSLDISNGINEFKSGILKYVVIDAHGVKCDQSLFNITSSSEDGEEIYIEVKYTENGYSKTGRIYPVRDYTRPVMIPVPENSITQEIKVTGSTSLSGTEIKNKYGYYYGPDYVEESDFHYFSDSNYTLISENTGNRVGVSGTSSYETFHRTIFEFDPNDFGKILPSSFTSDTTNLFVNVDASIESKEGNTPCFAHGVYNSKSDMGNNLNVPNNIRDIDKPASGISITANDYEAGNDLGMYEYKKYLYINPGDTLSRQYILNGNMKYIAIFPVWDTSSYNNPTHDFKFEMYIKSVYLLYYGVPVTSSASLLTIEDDYQEE